MRWDIPAAWWGMLAVAALGVWILSLLARRRAALERFAEAGLIDRLVGGLDRRRRVVRVWLRVLALSLLVAAAAGPRWGMRWEEVRREGIDLIVALDTSRSMLAPDVAPNRLERAKLAVLDLLEQLAGDRIGLVAFAGTAFLECPLTLDYSAFERSLQAIHAGIIPRGGTALGRAIDTALTSFEARQGKYQALVLITDGEDHEGEVEEAAERAAAAGVKIYAVGIGTSEGELLPAQAAGAQGFFKDKEGRVVKSRLDEQTLQKIAEVTGGAYVRGLGPSLGLGDVFRDHIAPMERRDVGSRLERRWEPRFQIPLALALVVLLIEAGLGDARRTGGFGAWMKARRRRGVAASALALVLMSSPPSRASAAGSAVEGYELYKEHKYGDAATRWREALLDEPDSRLLRFNLGVALYRDGKFDEAAQAFATVVAATDPEWKARAAYNLGNALYRQGAATREAEPQKTIAAWEQALGAYLAAMAADPADTDPKYGFELVSKQLAELREKLEKEKQQEEQEQQNQQQQPPGQAEPQEPQSDQQNEEQQSPEQQQQAESEQQQQQGQGEQEQGEQEQGEGEQQQAAEQAGEQDGSQQAEDEQTGEAQEAAAPEQSGEGGQPGEAAGAGEQAGEQEGAQAVGGESGDEKNLDRGAARAVLDTARREELGPGDVERRMMGAAVGEPREDW